MKTRIVFGVLAATLLILLIYYGSAWMMLGVVLICSVLAYLEFDRLFFDFSSVNRQIRMIVPIVLTIAAIRESQTLGWGVFWLAFVFFCLCHLVTSNRSGDFQKETRDLAVEWLGYVYTVSLFGFILPIAESPQGRDYLFLLFLMVFMGDTAAYFVGSRLGKRLLAAKLSPKKTVEGSIAAILVTAVVVIFWLLLVVKEPVSDLWWKLLLFSPLASVLAQAGDLFESLFKRSQDRKDSGHFLPGHGGILDRIDGLALVSPVYYVYLKSFIHPS